MVLKNSCNDIVIFLGAGFTHDLELPIMSNFGSESDRVYKGVNDKGNDKKDAAPIFRKAGDMFKKFHVPDDAAGRSLPWQQRCIRKQAKELKRVLKTRYAWYALM